MLFVENGQLLWGAAPKDEIEIPQYCEACFVWDGINWNVVYINDSRFVNDAGGVVYPVNSIVASGNYNVGDVANGDPQYEIIHNKAIPGDYNVLFSVKSNNAALYFKDNKLCGTWWHHATNKPNRFWVSLQEISGEVQNVSITWLIIKL